MRFNPFNLFFIPSLLLVADLVFRVAAYWISGHDYGVPVMLRITDNVDYIFIYAVTHLLLIMVGAVWMIIATE